MSISTVRGQKVKISDVTSESFLKIDIDLCTHLKTAIACFGLNEQDKFLDKNYAIYLSNNQSPCKAISMTKTNSSSHQNFHINLSELPESIKKILFLFVVEENDFVSNIQSGSLRIYDQFREVLSFDFSGKDFNREKVLILGQIYYKNDWRFAAIGHGFNEGLDALLKLIGTDPNTFPSKKLFDEQPPCSEKYQENKQELNDKETITKKTPMHTENFEILKIEAQRLIDLQMSLLQKMLYEQGVLTDIDGQTFNREKTKKALEILQGEKIKLERMEMVLAVVGTMKAGKSTSINAIVGTEVLPNRNRPMTALPTLIEHTPKQIAPILEFNNTSPIDDLILKLNVEIAHSKLNFRKRYEHNTDMLILLDRIESKVPFDKQYEGEEAIFDFLKMLNDLVRLSAEFKVDFPFENYSQIDQLPVIKIEFSHLQEFNDNTTGKLTLLDTPGPNEHGQEHLRKMLKEQLDKASGVLAVMDFTQLKSDADAQVREQLLEILNVAEGRLYVLVNKFDQKDRNGDSEEQTKALVANDLMESKISKDHVFPVSSKLGYLANRAKREVLLYRKLPNPQDQSWVADFGELAFGRRWEQQVQNSADVIRQANYIWEDSKFHEPLEKVIRTAHAQASLLAVASASAKLNELSKDLGNFLNTRETALSKSATELKDQIAALQADVQRVTAIENEANKNAKKMLDSLKKNIEQVFNKVQEEVSGQIKDYFLKGKNSEREKIEAEKEQFQNQANPLRPNLFWFNQNKRKERPERDFDPKSPILNFTDPKEAQELLANIQTSLAEIIGEKEANMKENIDKSLKEFQSSFSKEVIANAEKIIADLSERMEENGFSINLKIPNTSLLSLTLNGSVILDNIIESKTETRTSYRYKDNVWGKVCSWFGTDDWGWESYTYTEDVYKVDINKISESSFASIEHNFKGLDESVKQTIQKPLEDGINSFFSELRQTVEKIRGDLIQSIRDQEHSKEEQEALMKRLNALKKDVPLIQQDSNELNQDTQSYLKPA